MKGWAQKKAVLAATRSLAVQGWLRDYNDNGAVPCEVQTGPLTASTQKN